MPQDESGPNATAGLEATDGALSDAVTDVEEDEGVELASSMRTVNDVRLHTVAAGDPDDPLVVLLHGFPECWYGWHRQIEPLVDAGYRVLVPDQRGYNRSEKPTGVASYRISNLSRDVVDLIETEARETAHVVGHDWGGFVAWDLARRHPDRVNRLGIVNVPHYSAFRRTLLTNPRQLAKSWYMFFFQLPRIPEWAARRNDFEAWTDVLTDSTQPGTFTDAEIDRYRAAWHRDGAPTAMLDWYRAGARHSSHPDRERVGAPTLILWGDQDAALVPELAANSLEYCDDARLERFPDVGHFVQHEEPGQVADHLVTHLGG